MTMMGILQVASYIYKRYMDDFGVRIDEMKLHKLLYALQFCPAKHKKHSIFM